MKKTSKILFGIGAAVLLGLVPLTSAIDTFDATLSETLEKEENTEDPFASTDCPCETSNPPDVEPEDCPKWLTNQWVIEHYPGLPYSWYGIFWGICWLYRNGNPNDMWVSI